MKKAICILIMIVIILPCMAINIDIKPKVPSPNNGSKSPSNLRIEAQYDNGEVVVSIYNYYGEVLISIYDPNHMIVDTSEMYIYRDGSFSTEITNIIEGNYNIEIELNNNSFYGYFEAIST